MCTAQAAGVPVHFLDMPEKVHVVVAVPCFDARVTAPLAELTYRLAAMSGDPELPWTFRICFLSDVSPVAYARNLLVARFLAEPDADVLWFLDADTLPEESALLVLTVDADIVSGRVLSARPGVSGSPSLVVAAFEKRREDGTFEAFSAHVRTPAPMVASGAAHLLVRRRVLEDRRMRVTPKYTGVNGDGCSLDDEPDAAPAIFRTLHKPNGEVILSEDLDFVSRASALGYQCVFDPRARAGHLKTADLSGIEQMIGNARARGETPNQ